MSVVIEENDPFTIAGVRTGTIDAPVTPADTNARVDRQSGRVDLITVDLKGTYMHWDKFSSTQSNVTGRE
jgi:hypothetical protein